MYVSLPLRLCNLVLNKEQVVNLWYTGNRPWNSNVYLGHLLLSPGNYINSQSNYKPETTLRFGELFASSRGVELCQHLVLNSLSPGLCFRPELSLVLKNSCPDSSWHRIPVIIVTLLSWRSSYHRHRHLVELILLSSLSSRCRVPTVIVTILTWRSCHCEPVVIVLMTHVIVVVISILSSRFWCHLSSSPSYLPLLVSPCRASWHFFSIPSRRHLVVVVISVIGSLRLWRRRPSSDPALRYHNARHRWS